MRILFASFALVVLCAAQGCGLKGPLYLPEQAKPVEQSPTQPDDEAEKKKTQTAPPAAPTRGEF